jgi:hypothetical protein
VYDNNQDWRGCRFTAVKARKGLEEMVAWEVTCRKLSGHHKCRLRRSFAAHGGQDNVERMLKWWCLHGNTCKTQEMHVKLIIPALADLPTFDQLDCMDFAKRTLPKNMAQHVPHIVPQHGPQHGPNMGPTWAPTWAKTWAPTCTNTSTHV